MKPSNRERASLSGSSLPCCGGAGLSAALAALSLGYERHIHFRSFDADAARARRLRARRRAGRRRCGRQRNARHGRSARAARRYLRGLGRARAPAGPLAKLACGSARHGGHPRNLQLGRDASAPRSAATTTGCSCARLPASSILASPAAASAHRSPSSMARRLSACGTQLRRGRVLRRRQHAAAGHHRPAHRVGAASRPASAAAAWPRWPARVSANDGSSTPPASARRPRARAAHPGT